MKSIKTLLVVALLAGLVTVSMTASAADDAAKKTKSYTLKTCPVSDDKLGGDMGAPYVFTYKDREIKLCCKDCRKDFDKDPAKYIKKIEAAEAKEKK